MKMGYSPKIPKTEDLAALLRLKIKTSDAYKEAVNAILADTEHVIKAMVKEENEALEKSVLSGGSVMFCDFIHRTTRTAHTIEKYIDFKCRMSIPYTRRFFIDEDGVLVKTIEPMG